MAWGVSSVLIKIWVSCYPCPRSTLPCALFRAFREQRTSNHADKEARGGRIPVAGAKAPLSSLFPLRETSLADARKDAKLGNTRKKKRKTRFGFRSLKTHAERGILAAVEFPTLYVCEHKGHGCCSITSYHRISMGSFGLEPARPIVQRSPSSYFISCPQGRRRS